MPAAVAQEYANEQSPQRQQKVSAQQQAAFGQTPSRKAENVFLAVGNPNLIGASVTVA